MIKQLERSLATEFLVFDQDLDQVKCLRFGELALALW
jgi:hypothetical protein